MDFLRTRSTLAHSVATGLALALACACRAQPAPAPVVASAPVVSSPVQVEPREVAREDGAASAQPVVEQPATSPAWELPSDWDQGAIDEFDALLASWFPDGVAVRMSDAALRELFAAASDGGERGLRAVLVLARSNDPAAFAQLLTVLERRTPRTAGPSDRCGDAVDVVAAAAIANARSLADAGPRLESLSIGKNPHPDLDVRVQCAASAVALGRTKPIPYLLGILRTGTGPRASVPRGTSLDDFVEPQLVAARALSARAGVPCEFRPHAPLAARAAEADRLERLLARAPAGDRR